MMHTSEGRGAVRARDHGVNRGACADRFGNRKTEMCYYITNYTWNCEARARIDVADRLTVGARHVLSAADASVVGLRSRE